MNHVDAVREIARRLLSTAVAPDPDVLAPKIIGAITQDQADAIVTQYARQLVREEIHRARLPSQQSVGVSKWKIAKFVSVGINTWKLEDECTVDELLLVADNYARQINALVERERYYRDLAEQLVASGCSTLGEMRARESLAA
jgi:hypothetical protein